MTWLSHSNTPIKIERGLHTFLVTIKDTIPPYWITDCFSADFFLKGIEESSSRVI